MIELLETDTITMSVARRVMSRGYNRTLILFPPRDKGRGLDAV